MCNAEHPRDCDYSTESFDTANHTSHDKPITTLTVIACVGLKAVATSTKQDHE
jgi:hypothetical protein